MRGHQPALAPGWAGIAEEPAALIAHGGVCEEGGRNRRFRLPLLGQDDGELTDRIAARAGRGDQNAEIPAKSSCASAHLENSSVPRINRLSTARRIEVPFAEIARFQFQTAKSHNNYNRSCSARRPAR